MRALAYIGNLHQVSWLPERLQKLPVLLMSGHHCAYCCLMAPPRTVLGGPDGLCLVKFYRVLGDCESGSVGFAFCLFSLYTVHLLEK